MFEHCRICRVFAINLAIVITAAVHLTAGSMPVPAQKQRTAATFSNPQPISVLPGRVRSGPLTAETYPSEIAVSGMTGVTEEVSVTLDGLSSLLIRNIDLLLVSPAGKKYVFFGGQGAVGTADAVLIFDDDAASPIPLNSPILSGSFRPTLVGTPTFPSPAPKGPYSIPPKDTFASVFSGDDPNGTWTLFAVTRTGPQPASLNLGWKLTITAGGKTDTFENMEPLAMNDIWQEADPYGSPITISGMSGAISSVEVTVSGISHTAPARMDALLLDPNGRAILLFSDAGGGFPVSDVDLTFSDSASGPIGSTMVSGTFRPTDNGGFDFFTAPVPETTFLFNLAQLDGLSPNGEWRLFIINFGTDSGTVAEGWSIEIETEPVGPPLPPACAAPSFARIDGTAGVGPTSLAVADLNGDGIPDAAITNQISNDVSIRLGNGDGTFTAGTSLTAGTSPYAVEAADLNGDGNIDLAVANSSSNNISVFLGDGTGGFSPAVNFFAGASPISLAVGDINGDSDPDIVVANFGSFFVGTVSVLIGNGNGGFTAGTTLRTRTQPSAVDIGDLNGDGMNDLVVANFGADSISIFAGNGAGQFALFQNLTVGSGPVSVEIINGFQNSPFIVVASYNADRMYRCEQSGGQFSCGNGWNHGPNPIAVTAGDLVGSGQPSYVTAASGSNFIWYGFAGTATVGANPNDVALSDLNGDGRLDILSVNYGSNDLSALLNTCSVAAGNIFDFNGDRRTDFAVFRPSTRRWFVQNLTESSEYVLGRAEDMNVVADYSGDGRVDMAMFRPQSGWWYVRDHNRKQIYSVQFGTPEDIPVPADFDHDGKADIAVFRPSSGVWYIRRSTDNGTTAFQFGAAGDVPAAADFDGDGIADSAIFRPSTGVWYIWRSSDQGYTIHQFGQSGDMIVPGDYDGDGKADIAVWRPAEGNWYVLRSSDMGFSAVNWGTPGDRPMIGDFDGDGKYDRAVFRPSSAIWYILKSSDGGMLSQQYGLADDVQIPGAFVR